MRSWLDDLDAILRNDPNPIIPGSLVRYLQEVASAIGYEAGVANGAKMESKPNDKVERCANSAYAPTPCSALVKEAERVLKYLREIGEQTRGESTFPSVDYADAMADGLEYALKQNSRNTQSR